MFVGATVSPNAFDQLEGERLAPRRVSGPGRDLQEAQRLG